MQGRRLSDTASLLWSAEAQQMSLWSVKAQTVRNKTRESNEQAERLDIDRGSSKDPHDE
jgi:hypothetical protein